jgi:hypothetical protein
MKYAQAAVRQGHVALRMGLITCDHGDMASEPHVTLSGDIVGEYIVKDRRPNGESLRESWGPDRLRGLGDVNEQEVSSGGS